MCSQVHCFHSPSGINTDLGNRTSTGPTNQGGVRSHQTHLKNILVEGLVKQIASAELNTEHLKVEGRKLLLHRSSLVHHTLLESEGSRAPWSNDCKIGHLLKSELFSFSFLTFSPCSFPKITLSFTLQIKLCRNKILSTTLCRHTMPWGNLGPAAVQRGHNQGMASGLVFSSWLDDFDVSQHEGLTSDCISWAYHQLLTVLLPNLILVILPKHFGPSCHVLIFKLFCHSKQS